MNRSDNLFQPPKVAFNWLSSEEFVYGTGIHRKSRMSIVWVEKKRYVVFPGNTAHDSDEMVGFSEESPAFSDVQRKIESHDLGLLGTETSGAEEDLSLGFD